MGKYKDGFTLLELLICLAILIIVWTWVVPSSASFLSTARVSAQLNLTNSALRYAKLFAIEHQTSVLACPSEDFLNCSNNWRHNILIFIDKNGDDRFDSNDKLLRHIPNDGAKVSIVGPNRAVEFHDNGVTNSTATFIFCPLNNEARFNRALILSLQGRMRVSQDSDNDGIHEASNGEQLSCTD